MNTEIELIIPRSSSASLPRALAIARKFERLTEPDDRGEPYRLTVGADELRFRHRDLNRLYETVRGWKGAQMLVDGQPADMQAFRTVVGVFQCAERRSVAVIPDEYCQGNHEHGWGCLYLRTIQEGLPSHAYEMRRGFRYWFQFGHFSDDRSEWIVDKTELTAAINREAAATHAELCPFFNAEAVRARVDALPTSVELSGDSSWEVAFEEECSGSTIEQIPTGVRPKHLNGHAGHGLSYTISLSGDQTDGEKNRNRNIPDVSFADIGGVDEIIGMVREVIELPLKHPRLFKHLGIAPHKGILLHGPPGCGKTLIAKAIANDIEAHFVSIRGPELFSKWFGQSEGNLREIFAEAREYAPSVIFFDEIDAIAQKRSGEESARAESAFVNQLLTLMDGMETYENVCVIASTNRPELLDEAIMRPGRFDYTLEIRHPSSDGIRKILQIHTRDMPLAESVDLDSIASRMAGLTGADIAFVAREGAYNCLRRSVDPGWLLAQSDSEVDVDAFEVEHADFEAALAMVLTNRAEPPRPADTPSP